MCSTYPETSGGESSVAFAINSGSELRIGFLSDGFHDSSQLLATHDTDTGVGPHPEETRAICATAHAVVTSAVAAADDNGELGHVGAGDGGNELSAVLGDAFTLGRRSDHESGDVLQEDQRDAALGAELDKVGALDGRGGEEDAVVGDDANLLAVNLSETSHQCGTVVSLELGELGAVDDAGNDLTDGHGLAQVGRGDAEELLGVVEGL